MVAAGSLSLLAPLSRVRFAVFQTCFRSTASCASTVNKGASEGSSCFSPVSDQQLVVALVRGVAALVRLVAVLVRGVMSYHVVSCRVASCQITS